MSDLEITRDLFHYIEKAIKLRTEYADKLDSVLKKYQSFKIDVASAYEILADDFLEQKQKEYDRDLRMLFHEWFQTEEILEKDYDDMMAKHLVLDAEWKGKSHLVQKKYTKVTKQIFAERSDFKKQLMQIADSLNRSATSLRAKGKQLASPSFSKSEGFLNLLINITPDILMVRLVKGDFLLGV